MIFRMDPLGRRITVELTYVLPSGADQHLENAFDVFFEVVETAIKKRFSDYFCKTNAANQQIRVVALMSTSATTAEEAGAIVKGLTSGINEEIQSVMESKMAH